MNDASAPGGNWFVRFAGRRTGPYDVERLRTLARRGALTSLHFLSADGSAWRPATAVRAVFNADGSVASGPSGVGGRGDDALDGLSPLLEGEAPADPPRHARGSRPAASPFAPGVAAGAHLVAVRPVAIAALTLAAAALLCSVLADLPREPSWIGSGDGSRLRLAVRILQAAAVVGGIVLLALQHDRLRGAVTGAVAGVVAAASAVDAVDVPWACAALLATVPVAPMLALDGSARETSRAIASFVALASPLAAVATLWFAFSPGSAPWPGFAAVAAAGCLSIAAGGASALGWLLPGSGRAFMLAGAGVAAAVIASMIPAALEGADPALREVAVDACATLAFGGACWAATLGAIEGPAASGDLPGHGPDPGPAA